MQWNKHTWRALRHFLMIVLGGILIAKSSSGQEYKPDSVIVPASTKYDDHELVRMIFIGKNYRKEWSTPVKMPVFNLKKQNGGFKIKELGGGFQTKSLRLTDSKGEEWVLRTADKDVSKALDAEMKMKWMRPLVKGIVQDMISASHPYASLTVPDLARAAGVIVARPQLFFVPDDPAFGEYRELFANTVCFLEDRKPTPGNADTKDTEDVMEKTQEENDHFFLQKQILKARLLDMLIADWDRHEDQWKWGKRKEAGNTYYYPVPKDRDFAYFKNDGVFILFASLTVLPHMRTFTNDGSQIKKLSNKTWEMDAQWLNQLDEQDWKEGINRFQAAVTDSVISTAVRRLPREIYELNGKGLEEKLRSRRDGLSIHAMRYYKFLATNAFVLGSDEKEYFRVSKGEDGLTVRASRNGEFKKKDLIYERTFDDDTKQIQIIGLGGNDEYVIDENVSSKIKLQLIGGEGNDQYTLKGNIRAKIKDEGDAAPALAKKPTL